MADPTDADKLRAKGDSALKDKDVQVAIDSYTQAIQLAPTAQNYLSRAIAYSNVGKMDEFFADCNKAVALDPKNVEAYTLLGFGFDSKREYNLASNEYTSAINLLPGYPLLHMRRAADYQVTGHFDQAIADYTAAFNADTHLGQALFQRASCFVQLGDYQHAVGDYNVLIKGNPSFAEAWVARGVAMGSAGFDNAGIMDENKALSLRPELYPAYVERALLYFHKGKYPEATKDLQLFMSKQTGTNLSPGLLTPACFVWLLETESAHDSKDADKELEDVLAKISPPTAAAPASWWTTLAQHFLGKASMDDVRKAITAEGADTADTNNQIADFYLGMKELVNGDKQVGMDLLKKCANGKNHFLSEARLAAARLKATEPAATPTPAPTAMAAPSPTTVPSPAPAPSAVPAQ